MTGLNPSQLEAVHYLGGPLLVLAGAGSGKTRVITRKIVHLIREADIPARHICALTFTNKAAREMRERVATQIRGAASRGLTVSTFHRLGLDILRHHCEAAGLKPRFSLLDAQDSEALVKELLAHTRGGDAFSPPAVQQRISQWKNEQIDPAQAAHSADDAFQAKLAGLYADYERTLRAYNSVDFDDLIGVPVTLFRDRPDLRETWQAKIRYLLVDEYQDTNGAQYDLVRLLTGPRGAFTAVGDDDQSIYAWRGARPENLARLRHDYPHLKIIMLEQNYRSSARILAVANALIAHNPHVFEKKLWSALGPGDPPRVMHVKDEEQEAARVASEVLHLKFATGADLGDIAILYRGNHQARPFEKALREHNIPYRMSGGTPFFARAEVKDAMAYLRLLVNPDDDAAFLRIVNTPRREIGPTTLERLAAYAHPRGIHLLAACEEMGLAASLGERQRERLLGFARLIQAHAQRAHDDPDGGARTLLEVIDYPGWVRENASSQAVADRRLANVNELLEWLARLATDERGAKTLGERVQHLTLMDVLERQDQDQNEGQGMVNLMTLHTAKGLEFPHVFLVGMEEELLPHRTSIEEDSIEEERRLAYVGITRAQQSLTFTLTRKRRRAGAWVTSEPSRFLAELPSEQLIWNQDQPSTPDDRKARGLGHLHLIKGMLDGG